MLENTSFLNKIIKHYNDIKLSVINRFGDIDSFELETTFMDDEFITAEVECLKNEYSVIDRELKQYVEFGNRNDDYTESKLYELRERQAQIHVELAYLMSHNINNIDKCLTLLEGYNTNFRICLQALQSFAIGNKQESMRQFLCYMDSVQNTPEHYLVNKIFAELLIENGQLKTAIPYLRKAIESRPEDTELHHSLLTCYTQQNITVGIDVEKSIIQILER